MLIKGPGITPGSLFAPVASMVDLAPTMLELAAGGFDPSAVPEEMDGGSFAPMLTGTGQRDWKHAVLFEYQSIRDQITLTKEDYISAYGYREGEQDVAMPEFKSHPHDGPNNTFIAIRIINHTATPPVDLLYAEFADVTNPKVRHALPRLQRNRPSHRYTRPGVLLSFVKEDYRAGYLRGWWALSGALPNSGTVYLEVNVLGVVLFIPHLYQAWHMTPDQINFYELYDVSKDYYMLENIFWQADAGLKARLHAKLHQVIQCQGNTQCSSLLL